jgi:hypothetical protein
MDEALKWLHGEKGLLGQFHRAGRGGRFVSAPLVGALRDDSDRLRQLVDRLSQRLVLTRRIYFDFQFGPIISRRNFPVAHGAAFV